MSMLHSLRVTIAANAMNVGGLSIVNLSSQERVPLDRLTLNDLRVMARADVWDWQNLVFELTTVCFTRQAEIDRLNALLSDETTLTPPPDPEPPVIEPEPIALPTPGQIHPVCTIEHVRLGNREVRFRWRESSFHNRYQWFITREDDNRAEVGWMMSEINEHFEWTNPNLPQIMRENIVAWEEEHGAWIN